MTAVESVSFSEATRDDRVEALPMSHLSVETGHFYMEELLKGDDRIKAQFEAVRPWIEVARSTARGGAGKRRVSTCFLLDDYFGNSTDPRTIIDKVRTIAEACDIRIDYLVREAGCRQTAGVDLAGMVKEMLVQEPEPGENGSRPRAADSGWLSNGRPSPSQRTPSGQAMTAAAWAPPEEFAKRNHSIFVDVEMWRDRDELVDGRPEQQRTWSCPFLAAIWHLLRLGMLRNDGKPVAVPAPCPADDGWPDHWDDLPTVIQLNKHAAPFAAYRSVSILPQIYLPIEQASRVVLDHLDYDAAVIERTLGLAQAEGVTLSAKVTDRMSHLFVEGS